MHVLEDGICVTCQPVRARFDPSLHPHDPHNGKFMHTPGGSFAEKIAGALTDADALDAAPVRVVRDYNAGKITLAGVPADREDKLLDGLISYGGGGHNDINAVLRGGDIRGSRSRAESEIDSIDAAIGLSPLSRDVLVYRGIQDGQAVFGDAWRSDMNGREFREPAYSSTTADRRVVDDFVYPDDPAPTVLRIHVPAGSHAVTVSDFGEASNEEAELLLERGLRFRVVGDSTDAGIRHLDVEVIL